MSSHKFHCGQCTRLLELPDSRGAVVEVACWACDAVNHVDRYKMVVLRTET